MNYEVLVIGGGPAGSTASYFLTKEGIETCLVERNLEFKKPCGGGIPSGGLKDFIFFEELIKKLEFNIVRKVRIIPPFSEPIEVQLKDGEIFIFDRYAFDSFLRELALKSGAHILEGELISLEQDKTIHTTIKPKNSNLVKISSKYLIAADGINSKVCSLTDIQKPKSLWTISFQIPQQNKKITDACEFWFGSFHASFFYSWVFPAKNYLSVGTGAKEVNMLRNLIDNFIKKRFSSTLDTSKLKFKAFKIPLWTKRKFYEKNIILCGDALGAVMPITFEGIYYAMKSGQFAAEAIREKNLDIYEKLWNDKFGKQFFVMKKILDYIFGNDERIDKWLNIHRNPTIQELPMALWLRKEKSNKLIPAYLKTFSSIISRIALSQVKINM
jgi:geranylgeranyl reductase